jgi:CubicO group peptidase (beta-lactamase class C family)
MQNITIREILTMTSGLQWKWSKETPDWFEGVCSSERGADQLRNWLGGPDIGTKGKFKYVLVSDILSHVIVKRTGMTPREVIAKSVLPHLGMKDDEIGWGAHCAGPAARPPSKDEPESAFHDLRLAPVQMAKIGMLYLQEGAAGPNAVVVSPGWVRETFTPRAVIEDALFCNVTGLHDGVSYGYLWYKDLAGIGTDNWCASGMGGQYICIDRDLGRVLVLQRDLVPNVDPMDGFKVTSTDFAALDPNLSFEIQMPDDSEL